MENEQKIEIQKSSTKYQYLAALVVNLLFIGYGGMAGWCSPNIMLLTSVDSPLPTGKITMMEASWVASLVCVGGLIGNCFFGVILTTTNAFGRKLPLIFITFPTIIGWLLILYAQNVYYLYAARTIIGFVGGGIFILIPLYLNEIASDSVRGVLGSSTMFCYNIGIVLAFVLGNFCDYGTTPKLIIALTILFAVSMNFLPETPTALLKQSKISEAEQSIRFYQNRQGCTNDNETIQSEILKLQKSIGDSKLGSSFEWLDLISGPGRKAMIIGIVLASINQMCGCFAMLNYTANIFEEAGSSLSPNMAAIIVSVIQVIGSSTATILVDRAGRKFLFAVSTIGTAMGLISLGVYVMLKQWEINIDAYNWIPIASFAFVIFIAAWAILTLPFLVISEVLPVKIKDFGLSFCMTLVWILSFLTVKLLPILTSTFGFHGTMFIFAGCCLFSTIFIISCMPETRGKSHEEIMNIL